MGVRNCLCGLASTVTIGLARVAPINVTDSLTWRALSCWSVCCCPIASNNTNCDTNAVQQTGYESANVEIDCGTVDPTVPNESALQCVGRIQPGPGEGPSAQVNALNPVMSRPTRSVWIVSVPS